MPPPILEGLEIRPKASDAYLWCDYVELRCLAHPDKSFSRQNLIEVMEETSDIAPTGESGTEIEEEEDETGFDDDDVVDNLADQVAAAGKDRDETRVADIYGSLRHRQAIFADSYPFELDDTSQEIKLRDTTPPIRMLYLQLLLSSSLRLIPKSRRKELTEPFENLSKEVFACLLPNGWEVHAFGARNATRYKGHLFDRLTQLAQDLRGTLMLKKGHFKKNNSGDGGLDIVAWHPLGDDDRVGIPIALAQCGCTAEEWSLKSLEASPAKLGSHIHVHHRWATYYFMPQDLIEGSGDKWDWQRRNLLTESIVIDRYRLISLADQYNIVDKCVNAAASVEEAKALAIA